MILLLVFGALVLLSIPSIQSSLAQSLTEKINKDFGVNLKIERLGINWKGVIDLVSAGLYCADRYNAVYYSLLRMILVFIAAA